MSDQVQRKEAAMIKYIAIVILILVCAVLLYAAAMPETFRIERTTSIKAAAEKIYPYMSDFRKGDLWSPYEKKDPTMKRTYSGAESGKGSIYEFDGNRNVGKGRLEIIDVVPPTKVVLTLDMIEPMRGHNIIEYTLQPNGDNTNVTWTMHGRNNYLGKLICTFISMDKMVGKDFEAGLANLKTLMEKS
jgi:uncharacterized protein YndB with AHSA1/START domain